MISTVANLSAQLGSKVFNFYCANDASLQDVHAVLKQMLDYVIALEKASQPQPEPEEKKAEG